MLSIKLYFKWYIKSICEIVYLKQVVIGNDIMSYSTNCFKKTLAEIISDYLYDKCNNPSNLFVTYPRDVGVVAVSVAAIAH